ncbi:MAG: phosphoglucosamine mutase, partial [Phycisphaeraceae bacterium]
LHALGVPVERYYHFHPEPTGRFPRTPEPTTDNLADFCAELPRFKADVTFVQDPDADRLAIIDEQCRPIGEEYTLALCAMHRLQRGEVTVANLSTSRMIDDVAEQIGASVVRTPVGEANVASAMRAHHAMIGGEGNGGVILPEIGLVRNSLIGIALILELLAKRKQPLSEIVRQIPAYAIAKDKVPIDGQLTRELHRKLSERYSDQTIDQQDGVRIDWPDRWVHVRPSNTEPIVRLIAEARDRQQANALLREVKQTLGINGG